MAILEPGSVSALSAWLTVSPSSGPRRGRFDGHFGGYAPRWSSLLVVQTGSEPDLSSTFRSTGPLQPPLARKPGSLSDAEPGRRPAQVSGRDESISSALTLTWLTLPRSGFVQRTFGDHDGHLWSRFERKPHAGSTGPTCTRCKMCR